MQKPDFSDKIIIAHRGASGYLPEHTLEAKAMAHAMQADFIEQDLVLSKDDIPVVIHDIYLDEVTDVKEVYPDRSRSDGRFYVIDFTMKELLKLRVHERMDPSSGAPVYPDRFPLHVGNFKLHSLSEEIEFIQGLNKSTGKNTGIYPEIKNPGFHRKAGKDISKIVLEILDNYGYNKKSDRCMVQCFDHKELRRLREELKTELFLTQLMEFPENFEEIEKYASYANAIGPSVEQLVLATFGKDANEKKDVVKRAHDVHLKVHAYTFKKDDHPNFKSFDALLKFAFQDLGLDGVFTDFPDEVRNYLMD